LGWSFKIINIFKPLFLYYKIDLKKISVITILLVIIVAGLILGSNYKMVGNVIKGFDKESENTKVLFKTNMGDITIELYNDMPITTNNFENLVKQGVYNGIIFHRVINGFMIQGGDPTGTGFGDSSIPNIQDEFTHKSGNKNNRGTISMANAGPNTGSSQFFINLVDNNFLDSKHPAFGQVVQGMDIVDKIAKVKTGPGDKPLEEVKIIKAEIL